MNGETQEDRDKHKTTKQLLEENEEKLERDKARAQERKMEKLICLKDITVKIPKGQFVCIIGKVGSGKSSLLQAILKEMMPLTNKMVDHFKGDKDMQKELNQDECEALYWELLDHYNKVGDRDVEVNGSIAYTAQVPWIRNRTIRENILYNMELDYRKYVDTI